LLKGADWLIVGGGTLFHARGSNRSLLLQLSIFRMARFFGVRPVALGVGVSDMPNARSGRLLSAIIRQFDAFLVRDRAGLRQCAGTRAELSGDLAFGWRGIAALRGQPASTRRDGDAVALTVYPPA